jgi:excinuclease ABC subunit A
VTLSTIVPAKIDSLQSAPVDAISVRGARVHNLKNIDVDIPHGQLVVLTGVSGSGKSSLAFDTLHAEGQRRYLESLSIQKRQRIVQLDRPDVDAINRLPPTVCVDQRVGSTRIRSTLGTTTEIYDYLRLLFARAGQAYCPDCQVPVSQQSVETIVGRILALEERRKVMILAPLVVGRKGAHRDVFDRICKAGFVRARVNGEIIDAGSPPDLERSKSHTIEAIVDRILVKPGLEDRLTESVTLALKHGDGSCLLSDLDGDAWRDQLFSSRFCCPQCGLSFPPLDPRTFSFNSPYGACATCRGLGREPAADASQSKAAQRREMFDRPLCGDCQGTRLAPIGRAVQFQNRRISEIAALTISEAREFIQSALEHVETATDSSSLEQQEPTARLAALSILPDIESRLRFLERVGVHYLTLDRPTPTLSGGEFQRARLASSLGSGLIGVCYVLDEPTIGLHAKDTRRILDVLRELRDQGNSVLVVEHDEETMRAADYLIDLGPGAGIVGGEVVAQGELPTVISDCAESASRSQTLTFLKRDQVVSDVRVARQWTDSIRLQGASKFNLKNIDVEFPCGVMTAVTGVSGSGKSTLVAHTLVPAMRLALNDRDSGESYDCSTASVACRSISGTKNVQRLVVVDQTPIGRSARSNPATYTGLWNEVRKLFAKTRDARLRGFKSSRFSFNAKDGHCPQCQGYGVERVHFGASSSTSSKKKADKKKADSHNFLPDHFVECVECRGTRFNDQTLSIRYRDRNVADILSMQVDEAARFFENIPKLNSVLRTLDEVGLGYLTLGQSARTLSGGEAQRIKLATELSKQSESKTLFVLDEPTTGLHPADVARLLQLLDGIVKHGDTVIVVEHHPDIIAAADCVIEIGPEGGAHGGEIVG